jgi:acetyl esterase/lipase
LNREKSLQAKFRINPLLIQVGDNDILLNDSTRLAEKAKSAGVDVKLEAEPEMFHYFQNFAPFLPKAQQAIDRIGGFLNSC